MPDYPDQARFSWSLYLEETGSKAVPAEAFKVVRAEDECAVLELNSQLDSRPFTPCVVEELAENSGDGRG